MDGAPAEKQKNPAALPRAIGRLTVVSDGGRAGVFRAGVFGFAPRESLEAGGGPDVQIALRRGELDAVRLERVGDGVVDLAREGSPPVEHDRRPAGQVEVQRGFAEPSEEDRGGR